MTDSDWPDCDICGERPASGFDEDDTCWCLACIDKWEAKHGCYWANGQPKTNNPWNDDLGPRNGTD